jgi:ABC-type uncharacterized transport system ATPase subunit
MLTLAGDGDFRALSGAPGVVDGEFTTGGARLELAEGADTDALLKWAIACGRLTRFEVHSPDLQQIFVRLVGADAAEGSKSASHPETARVHA